MIFALEGPDGCGKSSLFDALRERRRINATFVRMPPLTPGLFSHMPEYQFHELKLWSQLYVDDVDYICDRHPTTSAPVYDKIFNRSPRLDVSFWYDKVVPVYIKVPLEVLQWRLKERGDQHICESNLALLLVEYENHIQKFKRYMVLDGCGSTRHTMDLFLAEKEKL